MHGFHNLATPNIKLEQTMDIAFMNINNIKLNVDINIVAMIQSQMKQRTRVKYKRYTESHSCQTSRIQALLDLPLDLI
jgi:hypothetical protein